MPHLFISALAFLAGAFLSGMININSALAVFTGPVKASWVAHGVGALTAVALMWSVNAYQSWYQSAAATVRTGPSPWWSYLGGLPGATIVVVAAITVNSPLGLTGTLVLGILGQVIFGLVSDQYGWWGLPKRPVTRADLKTLLPILIGSFLIIEARGDL